MSVCIVSLFSHRLVLHNGMIFVKPLGYIETPLTRRYDSPLASKIFESTLNEVIEQALKTHQEPLKASFVFSCGLFTERSVKLWSEGHFKSTGAYYIYRDVYRVEVN